MFQNGFFPIIDPQRCTDETAMELAEVFLKAACSSILLRSTGVDKKRVTKLLGLLLYLKIHNAFQLIVHNDVDLAVEYKADALHLPARSKISMEEIRQKNFKGIVGRSIHSLSELEEGLKLGSDYFLCGSVYLSLSKEGPHPVIGIETLKQFRKETDIPLIAIGGIQIENISEIKKTGVSGFSVLGPIYQSPHPEKEIKNYLEVWNKN